MHNLELAKSVKLADCAQSELDEIHYHHNYIGCKTCSGICAVFLHVLGAAGKLQAFPFTCFCSNVGLLQPKASLARQRLLPLPRVTVCPRT